MESCYGDVRLADGIRSRRIDGVNGLSMHLLEAGYQQPDRPLVLLLHGFPELAFSWRKLMPLIAVRGYHVIAARSTRLWCDDRLGSRLRR